AVARFGLAAARESCGYWLSGDFSRVEYLFFVGNLLDAKVLDNHRVAMKSNPPSIFALAAILSLLPMRFALAQQANAPVDQLIPWLLDEDRQLRGVAFSEVIFDATGKR